MFRPEILGVRGVGETCIVPPFCPDQNRLAKWHPLAQEFLILSQLNHLRIVDDHGEQPLDITARDLIARTLMSGAKLSWFALREPLKLPSAAEFNLEKGGLQELARNDMAARLLGDAKKPGPLAALWPKLDDAAREVLLEKIANTAESEELISWLMATHDLSSEVAEKVEKIKKDESLDEDSKMQRLMMAQQEESRRLEVEESNINQTKEKRIDASKTKMDRLTREVEGSYYTRSLLASPIPAILLGLLVWLIRQNNEQKDIAPTRRANKS